MEENKFLCTGEWNGDKFSRVIEAEDEGDARDHWMFWAWASGASLSNLKINRVVH